MLRYTIDRARPGLVTFHDIRPGNGVGLFLQPRSTHEVGPKVTQTVFRAPKKIKICASNIP